MGIFDSRKPMPFDPTQLQTGISQDPYAGQRQDAPGLFGKGRKLRDFVGYGLGALADQFGGQNPYQMQMDRDADRGEREAAAESDDRRALVQAEALARLRASLETPADPRTANQRDWEYRENLPETRRPEFDRTMGRNFQYSQQGIDAQGQIAEMRAAANARHRAPPRPSGGGVTPTARARYIAEAEDAIARGASKEAVYARLRKMGVQ